MSEARVGKWGKSLAVRIPGDIATAAGVREGERVEVEARNGEIVIRQAAPRFTLSELFQGNTPAEWRAAYRDAFDWGPDVGREIVEE